MSAFSALYDHLDAIDDAGRDPGNHGGDASSAASRSDPMPPHRPAPVAMDPIGSMAPVSDADYKAMIDMVRRDARKQSGLMGQVMNKLRGDDLQRRQYATLLRRIDASDAAEEVKLGLFVAASLTVLGFQITVSALAEMERYLAGFHPDSAAARAGRQILARQEQQLPVLIETIAQRGLPRALRPIGLDR